jgi:hypothetical protein
MVCVQWMTERANDVVEAVGEYTSEQAPEAHIHTWMLEQVTGEFDELIVLLYGAGIAGCKLL